MNTREFLTIATRGTTSFATASSTLPSLDGWRALSIVLVLGNHCGAARGFPPGADPVFKWVFDGDLGVRMFFIISGFLITWLMLLEHDRNGRTNLARFYARRGLRILPVYVTFLCVLASLQVLTPYRQTAEAWIGNLTFTTNFVSAGTWTSAHLWSLAVEEQFYFLWPSLFVFLGLATNVQRSLWILLLPICIAPLARVIWYYKISPIFVSALFSGYSFLNYFDSLAIGCACAILFARKRDAVQRWTTERPRTVLLISLTLIAVPYAWTRMLAFVAVAVPFGNVLQGIGLATLLMQSLIAPKFGFYPALNQSTVRQVGMLSYSLYIWQQIFCTKPEVFGLGEVWWMSFPYWLVPVFVVAFVSYYGLERPFLRLRAGLR